MTPTQVSWHMTLDEDSDSISVNEDICLGYVWKKGEKKKKVLVSQLCLTLCNPLDCSSPGSPVHGILQARILEWVAIPFSKGSPQPRDRTGSLALADTFYHLIHQGGPKKGRIDKYPQIKKASGKYCRKLKLLNINKAVVLITVIWNMLNKEN